MFSSFPSVCPIPPSTRHCLTGRLCARALPSTLTQSGEQACSPRQRTKPFAPQSQNDYSVSQLTEVTLRKGHKGQTPSGKEVLLNWFTGSSENPSHRSTLQPTAVAEESDLVLLLTQVSRKPAGRLEALKCRAWQTRVMCVGTGAGVSTAQSSCGRLLSRLALAVLIFTRRFFHSQHVAPTTTQFFMFLC